jgi:hypothetical protein
MHVLRRGTYIKKTVSSVIHEISMYFPVHNYQIAGPQEDWVFTIFTGIAVTSYL